MKTFPPWIKKAITQDAAVYATKEALDRTRAKTVCESSLCPNLNECYSRAFVTFLILGDICTRNCAFCASAKGSPRAVDTGEADRMLEAVKSLKSARVVITSVTRDDLEDGGAGHFVKAIERIRSYNSAIEIEVLVPDFGESPREAIRRVVKASPHVFGHNIETVKRLYGTVKAGASYERSLGVLRLAKEFAPEITTKSAILLGFGERHCEVIDCMSDLRKAGCDILAIGQYLQPSKNQIPVERFVRPGEFASYEGEAYRIGFKSVNSGPFVRSSYRKELYYDKDTIASVG